MVGASGGKKPAFSGHRLSPFGSTSPFYGRSFRREETGLFGAPPFPLWLDLTLLWSELPAGRNRPFRGTAFPPLARPHPFMVGASGGKKPAFSGHRLSPFGS